MSRAIRSGAPVINLSIGVGLDSAAIDSIHRGLASSAIRARVDRGYHRMRGVVKWWRFFGNRPLIVVAAGNDSLDARWSGYPRMRTDFPDQVLVVGAATVFNQGTGQPHSRFGFASFSNHGTLLDLVAPGDSLKGPDQFGQWHHSAGTSPATAFVSGVAGLLASRTLATSPQEIRRLILLGATRGGISVVNSSEDGRVLTLPMLNAYESLKAHAEQPGSPLCGNRVWQQGDEVRALHGNTAQTLFTVGADGYFTDIQPLHGGKQIRLYDGTTGDERLFQWSGNGWSERSVSDAERDSVFGDANQGAAFRSYWGLSHDRDTAVYVGYRQNGTVTIYRWDMKAQVETPLTTLQLVDNHSTTRTCALRQTGDSITAPACLKEVDVGTWRMENYSRPVYAPTGDWVYVGLGPDEGESNISGDWYVCPDQASPLPRNHFQCRNIVDRQYSGTGSIIAIPLKGGAKKTVLTAHGQFHELGLPEGLDELVTRRTTYDYTTPLAWERRYSGGIPVYALIAQGGSGQQPVCSTEFRKISNGDLLAFQGECETFFTWSSVRAATAAVSAAPLPGGRTSRESFRPVKLVRPGSVLATVPIPRR